MPKTMKSWSRFDSLDAQPIQDWIQHVSNAIGSGLSVRVHPGRGCRLGRMRWVPCSYDAGSRILGLKNVSRWSARFSPWNCVAGYSSPVSCGLWGTPRRGSTSWFNRLKEDKADLLGLVLSRCRFSNSLSIQNKKTRRFTRAQNRESRFGSPTPARSSTA